MKNRSQVIADLLDKPGHLIRRAHQMSVAIFESEASPFGITAPQHVVMTALFKNPGVDQVTLAGLVALDKVTTGSIVARLAGRGLLRREHSQVDGRARALYLTDEGALLLRGMQSAVRKSQRTLLLHLSGEERKVFVRLLRQVIGVEEELKGLNRPRKGARFATERPDEAAAARAAPRASRSRRQAG
ncbi:MAG: winged helix-turn-helix transcriptional regulator [Variovorax sp.]|nr:winged helix-turn-helix transcriptional regulator [Variovorax sp.]